MIPANETLGGLAALASAGAWALGSILFHGVGDKLSPLGMNLWKCSAGALFLGAAVTVTGISRIESRDFLVLGASGLLGIACGDTFFFKSLMSLGPRPAMLFGALEPVFTVLLALVFLREKPSTVAWAGIVCTVAGVTWVMWERSSSEPGQKSRAEGIIYALLGVLCAGGGIILAKIGMASSDNSSLQATFIRILWGGAGLAFWGLFTRGLGGLLSPVTDSKLLKELLVAVFVIIFGGFWLFLFSLKHLDASVAVILNSTAPVFVLPLAVFILKEKITFRAVLGAVVAVAGVALIFAR